MKIGLQTWGTDDDFMPFLTLAIGLKNAGHEVTLAYTSVDGKDYSNRKDVNGIQLIRANGSVTLSDSNPYSIKARPGSFKEYTELLENYFEPFTEPMYSASEMLCINNDLVIGHSACVSLQIACTKYNCPRVVLVLTPLVVESKFVAPIGGDLGTFLNSALWKIGDAVSTRSWFKGSQAIRKREGLRSIRSLQKEVFTNSLLTIIAASQNLVPQQLDWKEHIKVTGFLNVEESKAEELPADLIEFLNEGEPPIYMTFGSCMQYDLEKSTRLLVEAALLSGKRVIIQSDWSNLDIETDSTIYKAGRLPHSQVFPKCCMIVHHGGAGTTQASLLAGKPSIVIPHGFDQVYWAEHLFNMKVASEPILKNQAIPHKIAGNIKWLISATHIQENASDIGARMKKENGVKSAVELINQLDKI